MSKDLNRNPPVIKMSESDSDKMKRDRKSEFKYKWKEKKRKLEDESLENSGGSGSSRIHVPKTKYAIAFGYVGTRFHGYQKQVEYTTCNMEKVLTVEGTMESALVEVGAVHEIFRDMPNKLQMSKASRTDKGVHAGCTYIGGRFKLDGDIDEYVEKLNKILPDDIKCFSIVRVTKGFDARSMCSKRKYEYLLPEWILNRRYIPADEVSFNKVTAFIDENSTSKEVIKCSRPEDYKAVDTNHGEYVNTELDLERFRFILSHFHGTHDFFNFTSKQKAQGSTIRFIHKIKVKSVVINDEKAINVTITGQSFLYNQIRKMISLAVEVYLNTAPSSSIKFTLGKNHFINTNIAPADGLILHHPYFDGYNKTRCNPPQTPEISYKEIKDKVNKFKNESIYPMLVESFKSDVWTNWMNNLLMYPFHIELSNIKME